MGATGNPNSARLTSLQERKKAIEENLAKCTEELKRICLQESDLTGEIPPEMPLEPGETPPQIRRRVGTTYQLPENLIKNANRKDEVITNLELQIQLHAHMAEAALDLANEHTVSKTLRRKHMADYQQHKMQFTSLQNKLASLKKAQQQQAEYLYKQKKKPRPAEQDDNRSVTTTSTENFNKSDIRQSLRPNKNVNSDLDLTHRYLIYSNGMMYKPHSFMDNSQKQEENLSRNFYALSIGGYNSYIERKENNIHHNYIINNVRYGHDDSNLYLQRASYQQAFYQQPRSYYHTHSYAQFHSVPKSACHSPTSQHRQSSPNIEFKTLVESEHGFPNPHQIQPHQQYEHMNLGLGGHWKKTENGDVWCNNSSPVESFTHRDKRFGSLDRRKNKRIHKRLSPSASNKSATLASVPFHGDNVRSAVIKSPQGIHRRLQDKRQLIRTQSLGSVGGQTIDSTWQSDVDTSSESENRSTHDPVQSVRRQKTKEWKETSLDAPLSPHPVAHRSKSAYPSVLSPEEKYVPQDPTPPPLEIPAESNPTPAPAQDLNPELYNNNNLPKNCTLVQAGTFRPSHEETKPFEMSDFYKYSSKFKKSPVKGQTQEESYRGNHVQDLSQNFVQAQTSPGMLHSPHGDDSFYLNSTFDISNANLAERFSDEMNVWYKNRNVDSEGDKASKNKSSATLV